MLQQNWRKINPVSFDSKFSILNGNNHWFKIFLRIMVISLTFSSSIYTHIQQNVEPSSDRLMACTTSLNFHIQNIISKIWCSLTIISVSQKKFRQAIISSEVAQLPNCFLLEPQEFIFTYECTYKHHNCLSKIYEFNLNFNNHAKSFWKQGKLFSFSK